MKLSKVFAPIRDDLKAFESQVTDDIRAIRSQYFSNIRLPVGFTPINHLFSARGKALRPGMLLLSARAAGIADPRIVDAARQAAKVVELVHSASLIHDDVIDESTQRRSVASVHGKYGIKVAILAGDILFSHSFSVIGKLPGVNGEVKVGLFDLFAELAKQMCVGEMLEQQAKGTDSLEEYFHILDLKTARLMSASCRAGAAIAGADERAVQAAAAFGSEFGIAYQLLDDHIDGDTIYSGRIDLVAEADKRLSAARTHIPAFAERNDEYTASLHELCDWVRSMP